ncbi:MAG: GNAT family N-acetyltransferase [Armatimonadota bacterium]
MQNPDSPSEYTIIYLPPESLEWAGLLAQFTLSVAARDGRHFAAWAGERFSRVTARDHGLVALADGRLLGVVFVEYIDDAVEITFPWLALPDREVARDLLLAAMREAREQWPGVHNIRVERQLLPTEPEVDAATDAGFECHWRKRMGVELDHWSAPLRVPAGYRLAPWNIRELDAAALVVYAANRDTLDSRLYASFFGTSTQDCRHGLLSILAGKYGPVHPQATLCAFAGPELVGLNLVISNSQSMASVIEISVSPAHQGKGLGRAMMIGSLQALKEERYERVELAVTEGNLPAIHLYDSLGFIEAGKFAVCILP